MLAMPTPYIVLLLARRKGGLGRFGAAVRRSDNWALEHEIELQEQRLAHLKAMRHGR